MIDIIIVNWNAGKQLLECIQSIGKHHHGKVDKVIIVDNNSSDGSLSNIEVLKKLPFKVEIIRNSANLGFGTACNLGVLNAKSKYLLFLNPDTVIFSETIKVPYLYLEKKENADVALAGIQLVNENGQVSRTCARFPTPLRYIFRSLGINKLPGGKSAGIIMSDWDHKETREVDHVIGAFYFIRRNVFKSLGGFDERFFVYLEDLDLSLRVKKAGHKIVYLSTAQAYHAEGGTSRQIKARRLFYSLSSRTVYCFKNFSFAGAFAVLLAELFIEPFTRIFYAILMRSFSTVKETLAGYALLWTWLVKRIFSGAKK